MNPKQNKNKKTIPRHITGKLKSCLLEVSYPGVNSICLYRDGRKCYEIILLNQRMKDVYCLQRNNSKLTSQQQRMEVRKQYNGIFREVKAMNCQPIIFSLAKISFKKESKTHVQGIISWENLSPAEPQWREHQREFFRQKDIKYTK